MALSRVVRLPLLGFELRASARSPEAVRALGRASAGDLERGLLLALQPAVDGAPEPQEAGADDEAPEGGAALAPPEAQQREPPPAEEPEPEQEGLVQGGLPEHFRARSRALRPRDWLDGAARLESA